ncbi:hypothetical protein BU16DRAFT_558999 [Lophium mytilinum]|uniref:Protein kinase domain-containing protein n=1 Tax=Lophium mytilinum TaxID=390894 RepID=A0A6A6R3S0_9PEZI|nr:hypothetical protein BU16DRAFT_558999 [Lophium mytilinum]
MIYMKHKVPSLAEGDDRNLKDHTTDPVSKQKARAHVSLTFITFDKPTVRIMGFRPIRNPLPKDYIGVMKAGEGAQGYTYFCVPKHALESSTNHEQKAETLKGQLCVVKITKYVHDTREVTAMKWIKELRDAPTNRFVGLFDEGGLDETAGRWLAMSPILGPSLREFTMPYSQPRKSLPMEFVWHIFHQVFEGIGYLHSRDPPVLHGDFYATNIMLDPIHQDFFGFPNVVIIDFGSAKILHPDALFGLIGPKELHARDAWSAYDLIYRLTSMSIEKPVVGTLADQWEQFTEALDDMRLATGLTGSTQEDIEGWETYLFLEKWKKVAVEARGKTPPEVFEEIASGLKTTEINEKLDASLQAVVKRHGGGKPGIHQISPSV